MEDKNQQNRPLRSTTNKIKDLYNTYMKNEDKTIPVNFVENEKDTVAAEQEEAQDATQTEQQTDDRVEKAEKERDEMKDQLMRLAAEMENLRRRTIKEKEELIDYANERLLFKLITILDDLQAAIDHGKKSEDYGALLTGIELIYQKALKQFDEAGVKPIENTVGAPFDVDFHEAMMHIPSSDVPEGHIIQEVQLGYMIKNKVLRHTKVVTSAGAPEEAAE